MGCAARAQRARGAWCWAGARPGARAGEAWHVAPLYRSRAMFSAYTQARLLRRGLHCPFLLSKPMTEGLFRSVVCFVALQRTRFAPLGTLRGQSRVSHWRAVPRPAASLPPSPLHRLPELWWAWAEFANPWYVFKECSYKESFCVFWHN